MLIELELLLESFFVKLHLQVDGYGLYVLILETRDRQSKAFILEVMQSNAALIIHEFDRDLLFKHSERKA